MLCLPLFLLKKGETKLRGEGSRAAFGGIKAAWAEL